MGLHPRSQTFTLTFLRLLEENRIHITEGTRFNSFHALQDVMHIGSQHAKDSQLLASVVWLGEERFTLFGKDVQLKGLRELVQRMLVKARSALVDDVMKGTAPEDFLPEFDFIPDDFSNNWVGYSLFTDPKSPSLKVKDDFARTLLNHPQWGRAFGYLDEGNAMVWDREVVEEWLEKVDEFKGMLFFLIHATSGLPPHGTEASETLFCNTPTAKRNVHAVGRDLVIVHTYNKTTRNSGNRDRAIPRKLYRPVADLLLAYMGLVRSFEVTVANAVESNKSRMAWYGSHLWACRSVSSGKWGTKQFNCIFKNIFKALPYEMTVGEWRHCSIAIVRRHILKQLDGQPDIRQDVVNALAEEQMGHSPATGALSYAVEDNGLEAVTDKRLKIFMLVSAPFTIGTGLTVRCRPATCTNQHST